MTSERWGVYCEGADGARDWCLCWGNDSPIWANTREHAEDRAAKLTATSCDGTRYFAAPVPTEAA